MNSSLNSGVSISQLSEIKRYSSLYARFGNDYIFSRFSPLGLDINKFGIPTHIAALAVCMVKKGDMRGEVDSMEVHLTPKSLFVFGNANVVHFNWDPDEEIEVDILFISPQFIQDLNFDLSAINLHALVDRKPDPVFAPIPPHDQEKLDHLMSLLYLNATYDTEITFAKQTARCLTQAVFYELLSLNEKRLHSLNPEASAAPQNRQAAYVLEFMNLLRLHHAQHRSITFYADKLFISPKYLSHLIKEATGKSASEIIGKMIIQEAKNLLRYSNKNIKQIAYELNFSTQSSFGKYFKHITGLSPTEFQKK